MREGEKDLATIVQAAGSHVLPEISCLWHAAPPSLRRASSSFPSFFYSLRHHVSWRFCRTAVDALRSLHCLKSEIHKMFLNLSRKRYLDPWTLLNVWFRSKLPVRLLMWQPNMLISYWYKSNPKEEKETDQPLWLLAQCKSKKEKNILIKILWFWLTTIEISLLACHIF